MALQNSVGKVSLLRVHEIGSGYGPATDSLDVEVVFQLESLANISIGFKLRNDASRPVHEGMLDLLRDAFSYGWTVHVDYEIPDGKRNGTVLRLWLTRDRPPVTLVGEQVRVTRN
jgi:hypothetical protein